MATSALDLSLTLRYIDRQHQIDLKVDVNTSKDVTILQLIKDLFEFTFVDDIDPKHVRLEKIIRGEMFYGFLKSDSLATLKELKVRSGCLLHFGPTPDAPPPKALQLTIWGPDQIKSIDYRWYQAITTLAMLVEHIVEEFSLASIERERLHVLTSVAELKVALDSNRRLSEMNVFDRMSIYVHIVAPRRREPRLPSTASLVKRRSKSPRGLVNLGSTCYMNSAFQCLVHIPPLTNFFLRHSSEDFGDLTAAFVDLVQSLRREDDLPVKPTTILEFISRGDTRFSTSEQQDAQEFLSFFLESLHRELKKTKHSIIKQLFFGEMRSTLTCAECQHQESTSHPISFISIPLKRLERTFWVSFIGKNGGDQTRYVEVPIDGRVEHLVEAFTVLIDDRPLFQSILAMTSECELDFQMPLDQIFGDEIILIEQETSNEKTPPRDATRFSRPATLVDCLEEFFSSELLEEHWTCQAKSCQKKTLVNQQLQLVVLPPVLMIQFKRFTHNTRRREKIQTFVEYPIEQFDLKKFAPRSSEETVYQLIAVCNHVGSIHQGHYTAFARHWNENEDHWYRFDDSCVTRLSPDYYDIDLVSRYAYLLFYIRKDLLE